MKSKPLWHGIFLVAGGAIGAGMFALPMASAGAWLWWSMVGFLLVWSMSFLAANLLASVSVTLIAGNNDLSYKSSFHSLVSFSLGRGWAELNNISILFIMWVLMYAYISAGASIISFSLQFFDVEITYATRRMLSASFALIIATLIYFGTSIVSRSVSLLIVLMSVIFIVVCLAVAPTIDIANLINAPYSIVYLPSALPVYLTAFACGGLVPSLIMHYQGTPEKVKLSLFWGTLITLIVYIIWLAITSGSIGREGLKHVINNGNNIGELITSLITNGANSTIDIKLTIFSYCAIISSFLSISLGLFHFVQDKFSLSKTRLDRSYSLAICFIPPCLASMLSPYGFVHAIGFAALFVIFSFFIIPAAMAFKLASINTLYNNNRIASLVLAFGVIVLGFKLGLIFSLLPLYS